MRAMDLLGINPRRLGASLMVFGLIGVLLAGALAVGLIGGALAARDLDERLQEDQARVVTTLNLVTITLESVATTMDNASSTLGTSGQTITHAAEVLGNVANVTGELANALNIEIFGLRPLEVPAQLFADLDNQIRTFYEDFDSLAQNFDTNATDTTALAEQFRQMSTYVDEFAVRIASFDRTREIVGLIVGGILLVGLLDAWLAVAAAACMWVGWRLRSVRPYTAGPPG
jgi:hypothetical protein